MTNAIHKPSSATTVPEQLDSIPRGDERISAYCQDTMCTHTPDIVVRARDTQDSIALVQHCAAHNISITPCGARTAMTGSATADHGVLLVTEQCSGVIDIDRKQRQAIVKPGTIIADLQAAVAAEGLFYPPSPTSRRECTIGGTVATNATGDNTYKYGSTRNYIRALEVIQADGQLHHYTRSHPLARREYKNRGGYFLDGNTIDHFIGSEGTLGIVSKITVDLLLAPHDTFALLIFFPNNTSALQAIIDIHHAQALSPAALEYLDTAALRIMSQQEDFPNVPDTDCAALIIYDECEQCMCNERMSTWCEFLSKSCSDISALLDHTIVAQQSSELDRLQRWRHFIPARVNDLGHELEKIGGGKIGSDWWVPLAHMQDMMHWVYTQSERTKIPFLAFAHLGNGHPHVNYLTRTANERMIAQQLLFSACERAVELGGGVAGEHGIGKIKHALLPIQYSQAELERMFALKAHYDPQGIFAPGNIFPAS